jgi:hypothetical protein
VDIHGDVDLDAIDGFVEVYDNGYEYQDMYDDGWESAYDDYGYQAAPEYDNVCIPP